MSNQDKIRRATLDLLARRDHSRQSIARKLIAKQYPMDEINIVLNELVQAGLLCDKRFAENYIHSRREKGYGPERISLELKMHGISSEMIAEQLDISDNAWFAIAQKLWKKRFKGLMPSDFKTRAKQMRFLQYRGFTREQIEEVFKVSPDSSAPSRE